MASKDQKGPLSFVGDPVGKALEYGLKPIGHVVGAVGNPNGEALLNAEDEVRQVGKHSEGKSSKPAGEPIGGKEQTANNPLGL